MAPLSSDLLRDLRTSWRSLRRRPLFSFTVIATLAIALGANATVFTVIQGIVLRPVQFFDEDGLVVVGMSHAEYDIEAYDFSAPDALDFAERCSACLGVASYDGRDLVLGTDEPQRVSAAAVSPNLFPLLGVQPVLGRDFRPEEGVPGADGVVLVSHRLWQRRLQADSAVVGTMLHVDGAEREIVGVMPEGFGFPNRAEAWIPLLLENEEGTQRRRGDRWLDHLVARIDPAAGLGSARAEADAIGDQLAVEYPDSNRGYSFELLPYRDYLTDDGTRHALDLLLGAVLFVLLIASANVAHLMIVRDSSSRHETAVRLALGSGSWRLFRQRLTEGLLLACAGTLLGLLFAGWAVDYLVAANPEGFPYWMRFAIDPSVVIYAVGLAFLATLSFTLLPLACGSFSSTPRADLSADLREGLRGSSGPSRQRLQRMLVVCETALAMLLLFGAFLLLQSASALTRLDPGFETERLVVLRTFLAGDAYGTDTVRGDFADLIAQRLADLPGIEAAASTGAVPLVEDGITIGFVTESMDVLAQSGGGMPATVIGCTPELLDTLGITPVAGRFLRPSDGEADAQPVAVINQRLADRWWPDGSALGSRMRAAGHEGWFTVVGVAPDLYYEVAGEESDQSRYQIHVPYQAAARRDLSVMLRTRLAPATLEPMLRDQLQGLDGSLPVISIMPLEDMRLTSLWTDRLISSILGAFALVALSLAALGLYGVMAYAIVERKHEFGIRYALGADGRTLLAQMLREGLRLGVLGLVAGIVAALLLGQWISATLYGISDGGWTALVVGAAVLLGVLLLACWLPARRAAGVDPISALRCD